MTSRTTGAFVIDTQNAVPTEWEGGPLDHNRWTKTFTGELDGTSVLEAIMVRLDDGGPMIYVGVERITCTLHGRSGTFVLLHSATMLGEEQSTSWTIVPGSGTGELAGIRGHGDILPNHDFQLHYDIDSGPTSIT